jgi:uncharacterized membrane protein
LALLAFAAWLLFVLSWVMSVYAYPRLPQTMAAWTSLWKGGAVWEARSVSFFVYPIVQTLIFLSLLALAKKAFSRAARHDVETDSSPGRGERQVSDLRKEVAYLGLIFVNLVFIHLQTTLILVSHGLASGINRFYFGMLLLVLVLLFPYYRVRRRMLTP